MQILVISATLFEIKPAIEQWEMENRRLEDHEISILITGTGLLSTTYSLMHRIGDRRPDCIIQAGIAGSFREKSEGCLFAVRADLAADLGVVENEQFRSLFELKLADPMDYPFTDGFLVNPYSGLLRLSKLETVRAISVNEITTDKKRIAWYLQSIRPAIESMEGAALHYVCLCEKIPFIQIRAVSNFVGERDKSKWNISDAVGRLNEKLIELVKVIAQFDKTRVDEILSGI
jgi:futalosine hydrolase